MIEQIIEDVTGENICQIADRAEEINLSLLEKDVRDYQLEYDFNHLIE